MEITMSFEKRHFGGFNFSHTNHQNTSKIGTRKTLIRGLFKHLILGLFPDRKFPWLKATSNHNIPINQLVHEKT